MQDIELQQSGKQFMTTYNVGFIIGKYDWKACLEKFINLYKENFLSVNRAENGNYSANLSESLQLKTKQKIPVV